MKKQLDNRIIFIILFSLFAHLGNLNAQNCIASSEGTEFWFGFPYNPISTNKQLKLIVSSKYDCSFDIYPGGANTSIYSGQTVSGQSITVELDPNIYEIDNSEIVESLGLRLESECPVNVSLLNLSASSSDATAVFPTEFLSTSYYAVNYHKKLTNTSVGRGQFLIVATEDNTSIDITPNAITDQGKPKDVMFNIVLNQGESYLVQTGEPGTVIDVTQFVDVTGSFIQSSAPIAVFAGSEQVAIPSNGGDVLIEQMPGIEHYGLEFVTVPTLGTSRDAFWIQATQDGTVVNVSATGATYNLNAGEFVDFELNSNEPSLITSNLPVLATQYLVSEISETNPSEIVLSNNNQFIFETFFSTTSPLNGGVSFDNYGVNIVTETTNINAIELDGVSIQGSFQPIAGTNYSYAQITLTEGAHNIVSTNPSVGFAAYHNGLSNANSYAYNLGMTVSINPNFEIADASNQPFDSLVICDTLLPQTIKVQSDIYADIQWSNGESFFATSNLINGWMVATGTAASGCVLEDSIYFEELPCDTVSRPPFKVIDLSADRNNVTNIFVTWSTDTINDFTDYVIERSINGVDNWVVLNDTLDSSSVSFLDQNLDTCQTFYYRILWMKDSLTPGNYSNIDSASTWCPEKVSLNITASQNKFNKVDVNWSDTINDKAYYILERSSTSTDTWNLLDTIWDINSSYFHDFTVEDCETWFYRITVVTNSGETFFSNSPPASTFCTENDACDESTEGKEFWFTFIQGRTWRDNGKHYVGISLTSRFNANYEIYVGKETIPRITGTIPANSSDQFRLNPYQDFEALLSETIEEKGIRIVADEPINVYAMNYDNASADVATIYPSNLLGREYFALCYEPKVSIHGKNSEFGIVATQDNTSIEITPSVQTAMGRPANVAFTVTLNKGEVYQVQSENFRDDTGIEGDLTGSHIISDKPIAFFSGSAGTTIPAGNNDPGFWDHLTEQLPSVDTWGSEFITVPLQTRANDVYRILASEDDTEITVHATGQTLNLDRGEFAEYQLSSTQPSLVTSTKPSLLAIYSMSNAHDGNGDPFFIIISPTNGTKDQVAFDVYDGERVNTYFLNIITKTTNINDIEYDGINIGGSFIPIAGTEFSYAQYSTIPGPHILESVGEDLDDGFLAYQYAFGHIESYGYGIGFESDFTVYITSGGVRVDTISGCIGDSLEVSFEGNYVAYLWETGDTNSTIYTPHFGELVLTSFTEEGCRDNDTIYVDRDSVLVELEDTIVLCDGSIAELEVNGYFDESTILWNNGETDIILTTTQTGTYIVEATDGSSNNCKDGDTTEVIFIDKLVPDLDITSCYDSIDQVKLLNQDYDSAQWYAVNNIYLENNDEGAIFDFRPNEQSQVGVVLMKDQCISDTIWEDVTRKPISHITTDTTSKCLPFIANLLGSSMHDKNLSYAWSVDSVLFIESTNEEFYEFTKEQEGYVHVTANVTSNITGCSSRALNDLEFFVAPKPIADFKQNQDQVTSSFPNVSFFNKSDLSDKFLWDFGDGQLSSEIHPIHIYAAPGTYDIKLIVTNMYNCVDSTKSQVEVVPVAFNIPNVFRPNGNIDENNNFKPFVEQGTLIEENYRFSIYNRWGALLFSTNDFEQGWDGRVDNDNMASQGNYIWEVRFSDLNEYEYVYRGSVMLLD